MKIEDKQILQTFAELLPKMSQQQKRDLFWMGEGMAFKTEQQETEKLKSLLSDEAS